jgi:adenylate kinase
VIILFGVVGSGKSEQAKRLLAHLDCPYISTSTLLREHLTPERRAAMAAGRLVNDEDIFDLLGPALLAAEADKLECILDGAPRSVGQAKWLIDKLKKNEVKLTAIIHLKVSKDVVLGRLHNRHREDDQDEIIRQRFADYDQITTPVLDYLEEQGYQVDDVDGEKSPDEVETQIKEVLESKK